MQPVDSAIQRFIWPIALLLLCLTAITDRPAPDTNSVCWLFIFPGGLYRLGIARDSGRMVDEHIWLLRPGWSVIISTATCMSM